MVGVSVDHSMRTVVGVRGVNSPLESTRRISGGFICPREEALSGSCTVRLWVRVADGGCGWLMVGVAVDPKRVVTLRQDSGNGRAHGKLAVDGHARGCCGELTWRGRRGHFRPREA